MNNGLHEHIAIFVAVAQARSLTAASIATGIAQPTISRQLAALEKHLGCRLLQRSTRAVSLTEEGELYLRHAKRMIELNDEAEAALIDNAAKMRGRLRIACSNAFGRKLIVPALSDWQRTHPNMQIELAMSDSLANLVEEQVDVAFRTAPLRESRLIARAIGVSRRSVVASREYLRKHGKVSTPADLAKHQCIVFSGADRPGVWQFESEEDTIEVHVKGSLMLSTVDAMQDAVLNDLGIAVTPDWFWLGEQHNRSIVKLLPQYRLPDQIIHAVTATRLQPGSKVRRFIDHISQALQKQGLGLADAIV